MISNLDNAVEFTKQGFITIRTEKKKVNDNREEFIVSEELIVQVIPSLIPICELMYKKLRSVYGSDFIDSSKTF